jgi:hypothetical protein
LRQNVSEERDRVSTWWATERAKEALQTGYGLEDMSCTGQRMLHKELETNLCVDFAGNITDGPWGAIIGTIDLGTGAVRNQFGRQTGTVRTGEPFRQADMGAESVAG